MRRPVPNEPYRGVVPAEWLLILLLLPNVRVALTGLIFILQKDRIFAFILIPGKV